MSNARRKKRPTPYVVLTQGRTGSTMLGRMLAAHERIIDYAEVFNCNFKAHTGNEGTREETVRHWLSRVEAEKAGSPPPLAGVGRLGAGEILDRHVWRDGYPPQIEAVGFKLLPYQMRAGGPFPHLRQRLAERLPRCRAIVMTRENVLRQCLSRQVSNRTLQWHVFDEAQRVPRPKVRWTPAELTAALEEIEAEDRSLLELAQRADRVYRLTYEELVRDRAEQWRRVLEYLEVSPAPLPPLSTLRTETRRLAEAIENYAELRAALAGTRWGRMFEEECWQKNGG